MFQYYSTNRFSTKPVISEKGLVIITWAFTSCPDRHLCLLDRKNAKMAFFFLSICRYLTQLIKKNYKKNSNYFTRFGHVFPVLIQVMPFYLQ